MLEIGKKYKTKTGDVATVMSRGGIHFWVAIKSKKLELADGTERPYTAEGRFAGQNDIPWPDLVEEVGAQKCADPLW
jgi:hypothetical protein